MLRFPRLSIVTFTIMLAIAPASFAAHARLLPIANNPAAKQSIATEARAIGEIFGNIESWRVPLAVEHLQALQWVVRARHGGLSQNFVFHLKDEYPNTDSQSAGFISADVALREMMASNLEMLAGIGSKTAPAEIQRKLIDSVLHLQNLGALFGYDGSAQNGCAAPTFLLLIFDPKTDLVFAIDTEPCEES